MHHNTTQYTPLVLKARHLGSMVHIGFPDEALGRYQSLLVEAELSCMAKLMPLFSLIPKPSHIFQHFTCETLKNMGRPGYEANNLYL